MAIALLILGGNATSSAFTPPNPEADPLNHAYSVYLGTGYYVSNGQSVFVFRAFPKFRIRSEEEHRFGVRIRLNFTFGFYNLQPGDFLDLEIPSRVSTFAFVPGVEFPIKINETWTLMPFFDVGLATDTEFRDKTVVTGFGVRSRALWETRPLDYLLWGEGIAARNRAVDAGTEDGYTVLRADLDLRRLVEYRLFKRGFDLGLLAGADWYLDPILVGLIEDTDFEISQRYEIGLTTGPTVRWKFLKVFTMPRVGISYRFGEGFGTWAIRFRIRN
jgi:hypothetical protein